MFETIRAYGAVKMGLISSVEEAVGRQHTPKVAFVAPAKTILHRVEKKSQLMILISMSALCLWVYCIML